MLAWGNYQGETIISWQLYFKSNIKGINLDRRSNSKRPKIVKNGFREINVITVIQNKEATKKRMVPQHLEQRLRPALKDPPIQPIKASHHE
jgi:hypothetical protein